MLGADEDRRSRVSRWNGCGAGCGTGTAGSSTTRRSRSPWAGWPPTCVDGLLAVPFDSSIAAERAIGTFTESWIAHLQASVEMSADPPVRSGHVRLGRQAWHEVAVLKFVHQRFVLDRPDLAMFQRGQARIPHVAGRQPGVVADGPGRLRPGAAPAGRPGAAGHRRLPAGGPAGAGAAGRPDRGIDVRTARTSSGSAAAAASSTTWPPSPTTEPEPPPARCPA